KPFAKYWMHNGHINVDNRKMSKSEGNFFMVRDILKEYDAEAVRLFMLSAHYRSPINFSRELIEQATSSLERLYTARNTALFNREHAPERGMNADEQMFAEHAKKAVGAFDAAMSDDLNTADALAAIFEHVRDMNSSLTADSARSAIGAGLNALGTMTDVLGLLRKDFDATPDEVKALVEQRAAAKKAKDFALADRIRQDVLAMGYVIEDTPKGPMVKKA
ncbi:MAG: class I tRNA ligase family protein, partial [Clostridiales bacterium]|nr:class I tRNA ligase family protein [Clostridiales bacterium]